MRGGCIVHAGADDGDNAEKGGIQRQTRPRQMAHIYRVAAFLLWIRFIYELGPQ